MEFLENYLALDAPISRDVTFGDKTGQVHFKRLTGAQKAHMLRGRRVQASAGQSTIDVDLFDNEVNKHQMIAFCVVREDGTQFFKDAKQVAGMDDGRIQVLYDHCKEVNKEDKDPGKV